MYDDFRKFREQYSLSRENTIVGIVSVKEKLLELPFTTYNVADYFKDNTFLDMPVSYGESLGHDRLVLAYYCFKMNHKHKIVIDTGTFTTLDSVDIKGFNGGYILPGLGSILKSYESGDQLFSVENLSKIVNFKDLLTVYPKTTKDAIAHGALLSFIAPIKESLIAFDPANILLTGGNGQLLHDFLIHDEKIKEKNSHIEFDFSLLGKALACFVIQVQTESKNEKEAIL